ncbi:hypothetical protein [Saccharothrix sp. ST-888]|uniref:hypothetical protein n=1 Tax=Saccharothrix sp. ST-888 TaxID=1427391 RepID=UPI0012E084D7|nr:hypothetical protein [Saccharothrix sp. ST-888]
MPNSADTRKPEPHGPDGSRSGHAALRAAAADGDPGPAQHSGAPSRPRRTRHPVP